MDALRGALAAGLLPWPQTRARLLVLLAASLVAHLGAAAALPKLMAGVSPGTSAQASRVIRVSLRPAAAPVAVPPSDARPAPTAPEAPGTTPPPQQLPTAARTPVASLPIAPSTATATASPAPAAPPAVPPQVAPVVPAPAAHATAASTGPAVSPTPLAGPPAKAPVSDARPRQGSELAPRDADGPLSGPRYLHMKEVDQRPAPVTHINPVYPPEAGQLEGRVVVRLLINENGGIDRIEIVSADPPGFFERPTLDAFGGARYQPALKSNVRVKSQMTFEVKFLRDDTIPSPDRLPPPIPTGPPKAGG